MIVSDLIHSFMENSGADCGAINNERALQLELAYMFRSVGFSVNFEQQFKLPRHEKSTAKPKSRLDLLVSDGEKLTAIELKVPLNGQHPETLYSFCMDIEFIEAMLIHHQSKQGYCLMLTDDKVFWQDSGRGSDIHNRFRKKNGIVNGTIQKPTKPWNTCVHLKGVYRPHKEWRQVTDRKLLNNAKYLLLPIPNSMRTP